MLSGSGKVFKTGELLLVSQENLRIGGVKKVLKNFKS